VVSLQLATRKGAWAAVASLAVLAAACGNSELNKPGGSYSSVTVPQISASDFNSSFSAMGQLQPLAGIGRGNVAVILPAAGPSARYAGLDARYFAEALTKAGLSKSQFTVQNAQGQDSTELSDAQIAIGRGASVLVVDPLSSVVGASIEKYAAAHGVPVIDYNRLTLGGSRQFYVGFNSVKVGTTLGKGLVSCIKAWKVKNPNVFVMYGNPADKYATLIGQGYDAVLSPLFKSGTFTRVGKAAGTWNPPTALNEFQRQFTANPSMNALLSPQDESASPIITYLQHAGAQPRTFPVTGQDATLRGLQDILAGYQCGTVYKPFYLEAQAAAALAMYLRAGIAVPNSLTGGATTMDTVAHAAVASVLLTPIWVTTSNMNATVIADKFVSASSLCTARYKAACTAAGISG
jgi:D-xylose transport system substrate-binding protein